MKKRVISAVFMAIILIPILLVGGLTFKIAASCISLLAIREIISLKKKDCTIPLIIEAFTYLVTIYFIFNNSYFLNYSILILLFIIYIIPSILEGNNYSFKDAFTILVFTLIIGISFNLMVQIRDMSLSKLVFLFLISIMTDTFALITGMYIGHYKLSPSISPNKTVEGFIGGAIMGVFIPFTFYITVINPSISKITLLITTITLSIIGQLGDLVFSKIKREYKVKDYSNLIPGHGGILDRMDSIIFIVLTYSLFMTIV